MLSEALLTQPVGSPIYKNVPSVVQNIHDRLKNPDYYFNVGYWYEGTKGTAEIDKMLGKKAKTGDDAVVTEKDGIALVQDRWYTTVYMNAIALQKRDPIVEKIFIELGKREGVYEVETALGPELAAIAERTKTTPVPDGEYEANPLYSVPELIAEVSKKYKVSDDASALYLQLLALPFPSDAFVRKWNGWKKKQHDAAVDELADKKLVVVAKRARASRGVFIHGKWEPKLWQKPIEAWKFTHLGWLDAKGEFENDLPFGNQALIAPYRLFEMAWARVKSGNEPRFEEPPK